MNFPGPVSSFPCSGPEKSSVCSPSPSSYVFCSCRAPWLSWLQNHRPFTMSALTARSRKEGRCCAGSTRGQAHNSQSPSVVSASPPRSQFLLFGPWRLLIPVTLVFLLLCSSTPSTLSGQGEKSLWSCYSVLFQNHCLSVPCRAPDFCAGRQSEQLLWKI